MIRATFPYCTHGDDMMFVFFISSMDGLYKSGGGNNASINTHGNNNNDESKVLIIMIISNSK